ncbi:6824_t:CDS:2 [Paraglomus brasilianum]|uniref:6824_t:CDS:1 n=1 Tax=Paraglomus brasilianum TaxID=144538 RepID=A0A9N9GHC4_9GLOM|nr:6824_t:CDS:2 [Paraglomus brasilianum]
MENNTTSPGGSVKIANNDFRSWEEIVVEFLERLGLDESAKVFQAEMLVFPASQRLKASDHVNWLLRELTAYMTTVELDKGVTASNDRKRAAEDDVAEFNPVKRLLKIYPKSVEIESTKAELDQKIDVFMEQKKSEINNSNRKEFLSKATDPNNPDGSRDIIVHLVDANFEFHLTDYCLFLDVSCARSEAAAINRNIQMKHDVVNNEDGPLARSTFTASTRQINGNNRNPRELQRLIDLPPGVEERLQNIQEHLNVKIVTPIPLNVYERLRVIEDKIMLLERDFPTWASEHFNQPNQESSQSLATIVTRNANSDIVSSVTLPSGSVVTTAFTSPQTHDPPISTNSIASEKLCQPVSITDTNVRPIKLKGRANSSLTRSVMMQLEQMRVVKEQEESKAKNDSTSETIDMQGSQTVSLEEQMDEQMSDIEVAGTSIADKQNEIISIEGDDM